MTIVVAVKEGRRVCMGTDSQVTYGDLREVLTRSKMVKRGPVLFGIAGAIAGYDWIEHIMPEPTGLQHGLRHWAVTAFLPEFYAWLKGRDLLRNGEHGDRITASAAVIAYQDQIVLVDRGQGVTERSHWAVCGAGEDFAAGAMTIMQEGTIFEGGAHAERCVVRTIEAACELSIQCCPPVRVAWTNEKPEYGVPG